MNAVQIGKATPNTAPIDIEGLIRLGKYQLRSLATELGMFTNENEKVAFTGLPTPKQADVVLRALLDWRHNNGLPTNGATPAAVAQTPAVAPPVVPAPDTTPAQVADAPVTPGKPKRQPSHKGVVAQAPSTTQAQEAPQTTAPPAIGNVLMFEETVRKLSVEVLQANKTITLLTKIVEGIATELSSTREMVQELVKITQAQGESTRRHIWEAQKFPTALMFMQTDANEQLGALGRDEVMSMAAEDMDQLSGLVQDAINKNKAKKTQTSGKD